MPAGRPRKPTSQHHLDGTFRRDRHSTRDILAGDPPTMPSWLSGEAAALWDSVNATFPAGGLVECDAAALAMLCHSYGRWHYFANSTDGDEYKRAVMASMFAKQFTSLASRFGLTPSDRAKLSLPVADDLDEREAKFYGTREGRNYGVVY